MVRKRTEGMVTRLPAALMLACLLAGIAGISPGTRAEVVEKIVAVVNEEIITLSELREISLPYLARMKEAYPRTYSEEEIKTTEWQILNQLVDEKLINQEAERLKIEISEKEVTLASREVRDRASLTEEQFERVLAEDGLTIETYREKLRDEMKKMRLIDQEIKGKITVTKKEIDDYYKAHGDEYEAPPEVRLQQILLLIPAEAHSREIEALRAKAEQILRAIRGGEDFNAMARRYSQDAAAASGGDMGVFRQGELYATLDEAAFSLAVGEVSSVIRTPTGFHILRVLTRKDRRLMTEEERREEIDDLLYNRKIEDAFKQWLKELKKRSYVAITL